MATRSSAKNVKKALNDLQQLAKVSKESLKDKKSDDINTDYEILSKNYKEIDTSNKILEVYLKVLLSILPLVEEKCKQKTHQYSVTALTSIGEAIRQTVLELEVYKDSEEIMEEKITPHIQFHHDQVVKQIASYASELKKDMLEIIPKDKENKANVLLIGFLKNLGEHLKDIYGETLDKIRDDILTVKGL